MTTLKPTGPRLALMRAIVNEPGTVVYLRRWGRDPDEVRYRPDGGIGKAVTGIYKQFDEAELVKRGPGTHASAYAPQPIVATDAGRAWLAEHDKES